jgi:hypothetical protein
MTQQKLLKYSAALIGINMTPASFVPDFQAIECHTFFTMEVENCKKIRQICRVKAAGQIRTWQNRPSYSMT